MNIPISPKEKAQQIIDAVYKHAYHPNILWSDDFGGHTKKLALMICDEVLSLKMVHHMGRDKNYSEGQYYERVKEEINKILK